MFFQSRVQANSSCQERKRWISPRLCKCRHHRLQCDLEWPQILSGPTEGGWSGVRKFQKRAIWSIYIYMIYIWSIWKDGKRSVFAFAGDRVLRVPPRDLPWGPKNIRSSELFRVVPSSVRRCWGVAHPWPRSPRAPQKDAQVRIKQVQIVRATCW